MAMIARLSAEKGTAFLVVTHDVSMLGKFDRVLDLADGTLVDHVEG